MSQAIINKVETPRVEERKGILIAGLRGRYDMKTAGQIPEQWKMFAPYAGKIGGQVGECTFGVVKMVAAGKFDYVSGVEITNATGVPVPLLCLPMAAHRYLIFPYRDHVSKIRDTIGAIWNEWLPASEYRATTGKDVPGMVEFYGADFNPRTGLGTMELWIPIQ
jgi:AraC family transcriptional regulator